ncbi:hypothetical protein [Hyperthermus butylicus]|uniref:Uncharacterized protein n=1 Tax=Hyperthermus butylicus (strain DSM 5456 / JCM 9403 / PLM1-5) TaxID=415426 RepID=A2BN03_HYPBU|nr:hypothetical protein [Hyperthermus butylicus]ABM81364.1 hypothetical protein Hbut_1542 [Hyperthermus butylicus DSM 5456]
MEPGEIIVEALSRIRSACSESAARDLCEELEDILVVALDEAREYELSMAPRYLVAVEALADRLEAIANTLELRGAAKAGAELREAAQLLRRLSASSLPPGAD